MQRGCSVDVPLVPGHGAEQVDGVGGCIRVFQFPGQRQRLLRMCRSLGERSLGARGQPEEVERVGDARFVPDLSEEFEACREPGRRLRVPLLGPGELTEGPVRQGHASGILHLLVA